MLLTPESVDTLVAEVTPAHQELLAESRYHYTERAIYPVQGRLYQLVRTVAKEGGDDEAPGLLKYHLEDGKVSLPEVSMVPSASGVEFRLVQAP